MYIMSGMVHTAKRLLPYATNKVVHIEAIKDPAMLRLLKDKRTLSLLRLGLKDVDSQYEILLPYRVDDEEQQLKRFIQWKLGTTVNLSTLRREHLKYYLKLYGYGSPADVLRRWGLSVTHNSFQSEEDFLEALEDFKVDGIVSGVSGDSGMYRSMRYYASKTGKSISEYLADKGITYNGRADSGTNKDSE
jgi:hypothetical protein